MPQVRRLQAHFGEALQVIGIHTPKFPNEKKQESLSAAVARLGIEYPVANDAQGLIWRSYGVRAWPTSILIDPQGYVLGRHEGEFTFSAMASVIERVCDARPNGMQSTERAQELDAREAHALRFPGKVLFVAGELFVSDSGHHRILHLDRSGRIIRVFGSAQQGLQDGPPETARFSNPQGLAVADGLLYVADTDNHALRAIDLKSGVVRTLAGDGIQSDLWSSPWDLVVDRQSLLVAMAGRHTIVSWSAQSGSRLVAGSGHEGLRDGAAKSAQFAQPSGLALAPDGTLYVADSETSAVRAIDPQRNHVSTLVGEGLFEFGDRDGQGREVRLQHPLGVAFAANHLYVADTYNHKIKCLDPNTARCWTIAGGVRFAEHGSPAADDSDLFEPSGLCTAPEGLYVADTNHHRLCLLDFRDYRLRTLQLGRSRGADRSAEGI